MSRIVRLAIVAHKNVQQSLIKRFITSQQQVHAKDHQTDILEVKADDGKLLKLSLRWLRDSCQCPSCKHPETGLRLHFDIDQPMLDSSRLDDGLLHLTWRDGHQTSLSVGSLLGGVNDLRASDAGKKTLWDKEIAKDIPFARLDFQQLLSDEKTLAKLLKSVLQYGIGIVDGVPPTAEHTKQIMDQVGPILRTFWGEVYDVVADLTQFAHPSYTGNTLPMHTDTCYYHQAAGLQAFHVLKHEGEGGINCFIDGYNVAQRLKERLPHVYNYLSTTSIPFRYYEESKGLHLINDDYIIKHYPNSKEVMQIRYTPFDFDIFRTIPQKSMIEFYKCLDVWRQEMIRDDNLHWIHLKPGSVLMTDNWRVLHGRSSFTGKRSLCGMYVSRSDLLGRARSLNVI